MNDKKRLYDFCNYKPYLLFLAKNSSEKRGYKSRLAKAIGCQSAYLSQVLHGNPDLTLEQAENANQFLHHTPQESRFFIFLVLKERSGTVALRRQFQLQIEEIQAQMTEVSARLAQQTTLSPEDQAIYYSSWIFAAIHLAVSIPRLQTQEQIAEELNLPLQTVSQAFDFLQRRGLVVREQGRFKFGPSRIFLGKDSPHLPKHHLNWRLQAIDSLDRIQDTDLHYSSVFTLSKEDVILLKGKFLEFIKDNLKVIQASKEESLYSFNMDFFGVSK